MAAKILFPFRQLTYIETLPVLSGPDCATRGQHARRGRHAESERAAGSYCRLLPSQPLSPPHATPALERYEKGKWRENEAGEKRL